jgi:ABC-2 type transport system ATP-binding protein/lipopolysaccharide transport system ATP-binding protein
MTVPSNEADIAILVENVSKKFVLHHNRTMSLKARFIGLFKQRWRQRDEDFHALEDISFQVQRGEAFALMGPNGSGKSTLLQIIAGILKPTTGRVETSGRVAPLIELGVGFHPELTGEENIYLNASLYGFSNKEIRNRFDEIVEFSELRPFIDVPVKNYSSGMFVRLGFSVAVHLDPEILLADEILSVGDAQFQEKSLGRILELRRNGMTLLLVSHSMEMVRNFCDRFIRLEHGRVVESGVLSKEQAAEPPAPPLAAGSAGD